MTALNQYARLEASGVWRETPQTARRDVIVSFGDATLVLSDPRSEMPLAHWSLPAVIRLNPGTVPARYSPGGVGVDEELELDDDLMISAMEKVHRVIEERRPHPGRLRGTLMMSAAVAMCLIGFFWLPPALMQHAAKVAPPAQQAEIGRIVLADLARSTGSPCARPNAAPALDRLAARLLGPGQKIAVLPTTLHTAIRLPGPVTVIGNDLIEAQQSSEPAAGHILAAEASAFQHDPMLGALRFAGPRAALRLLTSGELPEDALTGYGELLLARSSARPDDEALLELFSTARISSEPYARSLDPTGETTLALIEADPFRTAPPAPVLDDRSWIVLQQICDE